MKVAPKQGFLVNSRETTTFTGTTETQYNGV